PQDLTPKERPGFFPRPSSFVLTVRHGVTHQGMSKLLSGPASASETSSGCLELTSYATKWLRATMGKLRARFVRPFRFSNGQAGAHPHACSRTIFLAIDSAHR